MEELREFKTVSLFIQSNDLSDTTPESWRHKDLQDARNGGRGERHKDNRPGIRPKSSIRSVGSVQYSGTELTEESGSSRQGVRRFPPRRCPSGDVGIK